MYGLGGGGGAMLKSLSGVGTWVGGYICVVSCCDLDLTFDSSCSNLGL